MPVLVATRMKVRRARDIPAFMIGTVIAAWQAVRTPGFRRGCLRVEAGPVFWTLTVWESGRAMTGFRDTGAHARLVPRLQVWASDAVFGVWSAPTVDVPSWQEVGDRVAAHPNLPPLDHPASSHGIPELMAAQRRGLDLVLPSRRAPRVSRREQPQPPHQARRGGRPRG